MKITKEFMINGDVVSKVATIGNFEVYQIDKEEDYLNVLYFVDSKTEEVRKTLKVYADCSQNSGYISNVTWS